MADLDAAERWRRLPNQLGTDAHALSLVGCSFALSVTGSTAQFNNQSLPHVVATGSYLDMTDLTRANVTATYVENGAGTSGLLTVNDGTHHAAVTLVGLAVSAGFSGSATTAGFVFTADGGAGTHVAWQ